MLPSKPSDRLRLLPWTLPAAIALFAAIYQIELAQFVNENFGAWAHYGIEFILYGTMPPILMWFILDIVRTWVVQKEQAEAEVCRLNMELQEQVEEQTGELRIKAEALTTANKRLLQLDQLKSEFVSLVSHELRTPLTNVRSDVELMETVSVLRLRNATPDKRRGQNSSRVSSYPGSSGLVVSLQISAEVRRL